MQQLPVFKPWPRDAVVTFLKAMLTPTHGMESYYVGVIEYPDHHYRVLFRPEYFVLPEGQTEPSRSQWNTLKKKFKRHNKRLFIFKDHGETACGNDSSSRCYYIDFGYFSQERLTG